MRTISSNKSGLGFCLGGFEGPADCSHQSNREGISINLRCRKAARPGGAAGKNVDPHIERVHGLLDRSFTEIRRGVGSAQGT